MPENSRSRIRGSYTIVTDTDRSLVKPLLYQEHYGDVFTYFLAFLFQARNRNMFLNVFYS